MATKRSDDAGLSAGTPAGSPTDHESAQGWSNWADSVERRLASADGGDTARLDAIEERLNKQAADNEKFRTDNSRVEGAPEALEQRVAALEANSTDRNAAGDKQTKGITDRLDAIEAANRERRDNVEARGGYVTRQQLTQAMEETVKASRPSSASAYVTRSEVETLIERKIEAAKKPFA